MTQSHRPRRTMAPFKYIGGKGAALAHVPRTEVLWISPTLLRAADAAKSPMLTQWQAT